MKKGAGVRAGGGLPRQLLEHLLVGHRRGAPPPRPAHRLRRLCAGHNDNNYNNDNDNDNDKSRGAPPPRPALRLRRLYAVDDDNDDDEEDEEDDDDDNNDADDETAGATAPAAS